ncbi:MAG: NADPH:quinone reductase [Solirubrobacteraceae bacterium]
MRAATYGQPGPDTTLTVRDLPTPEPGPGEVRVRVAISGVNPTDWKSRVRVGAPMSGPFQVPNQDGAGTIDAVGDGVAHERVGQRVWLYFAAMDNVWGTAAEYCVLPAERAVPLPDDASFELGASLGVPALTAAYCLNSDRPVAGRTVLVTGGAGAVAHAAIQLARFQGAAQVITTVSSEAKAELARTAGADTVVNYHDPDAAHQIRAAAPSGVDTIVEVALAGNIEMDLDVAAQHAVITAYAADPDTVARVPVRRLMAANLLLRCVLLYGVPTGDLAAAVQQTKEAVAAHALTTMPLHRYTLDQAQTAHDAVAQGAIGKVVIDLT